MDARELFEAGDIVVNTWGYDQTNVDFFEVTIQAALIEARNWIVECGLESEDIDVVEEYVSDMSDYSVLRYVQKYFSGGICGFVACCVVGS